MTTPAFLPVGLCGHGLLISPVAPCTIAREPDDLVWIDAGGGGGGMASIRPGKVPASGALDAVAGKRDVWRYGADGPELSIQIGPLDSVIQRIDVGIADAPWCVLGPGFWIDLPVGFLLHSPQRPGERFPVLQLREADLRGPCPIHDAMILFDRRPIPASAVRLTGPHHADESVLDTPRGKVRTWDYLYEADGQHWMKRHYALPLGEHDTLLMAAQAPTPHADRMFEGADFVAASYAPLRG